MALRGKTALITGGTGGIGLGVAQRLAKDGARLVLSGLMPAEEGMAICRQLAAGTSAPACYLRADLRDPAQIAGLMAQAREEVGGLDILINNAGLQHVSPIEEFPVDAWDAMLAVNLSASFHTIRLALPGMRERGWGRIINIASISGLRGRAGKSAYNATKHGLIGLTKAVALETADTDITCNAICPGWTLTAMVQRQVDALAQADALADEDAARKLLGQRQPSGRFVTTAQLASLVAYLCSDDAQEVRGAAWTMDGGTTAA